ncbi:MAG: hypothetical protein QM778_08840 [Myxococcales bacterium]
MRSPTDIFGPKQYLLVLSHMRSHSSLLAHILGSHPGVTGHAEMHCRYSTPLDLVKLRCRVIVDNGGQLTGQYVLDKVLWSHLHIDERILCRPDLKVVFLLRDAPSTLRSIVNLGVGFDFGHWYRDASKVSDYYVERLRTLRGLADTLHSSGRTSFFLHSSELVDDSDAVLADLGRWLGLQEPLRPQYDVFDTTGRRNAGDPSEHIKARTIVKSRPTHDFDLDPALVQVASRAHDECLDALRRVCVTSTSARASG